MKNRQISLEDAMLLTGFGKYNICIFILCIVIMIGMVFETLGLSYIIPAAQCDLELTLTQKGWLGAIPFVGVIASSHFWGWLADTRGRKPVIMWSTGIGSCFSIISSFCPDLTSFAIMRFIAAVFIAAPSSIVIAYLGEFNNPRERDRMVIFTCAFITFGSFMLPGIAWAIYPSDFRIPIEVFGIVYKPWRLLIVVLALPYFVCSFIMAKAPETPKFLASQGKTEEALKIIEHIYFVNQGKNTNPFEDVTIESQGPRIMSKSVLKSMCEQTVPLFKRPLLFYTMIACFVQFGTFANVNGFYLWLPEMLNRMMNQKMISNLEGTVCDILKMDNNITFGEDGIDVVAGCVDTVHTETFIRSMILGAIYCPFPAVAAFFVHRFGKRNILAIVPFVCGISSYAIYWTTNQNVSLVLLAIMQIDSVCIGMMNAVVVELYPTHLRAMAVSLALMAGRIGSILGSNLIGYLIEVCCSLNFFLFGSLLILNSLICLLLPKTKKIS